MRYLYSVLYLLVLAGCQSSAPDVANADYSLDASVCTYSVPIRQFDMNQSSPNVLY